MLVHAKTERYDLLNTLHIYPTNTEKMWINPQTPWSSLQTYKLNGNSKRSVITIAQG